MNGNKVVINGKVVDAVNPVAEKKNNEVTKAMDEQIATAKEQAKKELILAKNEFFATRTVNKTAIDRVNQKEDEIARLEARKAALLAADVFTDTGVENIGYIPTSHNYAISEGLRFKSDESNVRFVYPGYESNYAADIVNEGEIGEAKTLIDLLHSVSTEKVEVVRLSAVLSVFESAYKDDTETMDQAIDDLLDAAIENAENREALSKLIEAKAAVKVGVGSLISTINNNLCAVAKRNAEIWTNDSGFAALDITVNGVRMIERDPASGEFIYDRKYIVRQFSDTVLPNTEDGAPRILIGDFKNVLRFGIITTQDKRIDAVFPANIYFNRYVKEVIALTTTQNNAWISCYIGE